MIDVLNNNEEFFKNRKEWYTFPLTFWEIVEKLDWKGNNYAYKLLSEKLWDLVNHNLYIFDYFNDIRITYKNTLEYTIQEYSLKKYNDRCSTKLLPLSDDSVDDLLNHIIGLGKDVYYEVLNNPEKVVNYINDRRESFAYCFQLPQEK